MILMKRLRFVPMAVLMVLAFISCDDDFTTIGGELIGGEFDSLPHYKAGVVAYSRNFGPVQSNGLSNNLLGVYNEPVYGQQEASVLTQLSLTSNNPVFGTDAKLDSVVLSLPYFSTQVEADANGDPIYKLDSIYGSGAFKLTVSRSNYFLNDFDPAANFQSRQKYYSDQGELFENNLVGSPLYVNESFVPSSGIVTYTEKDIDNQLDTIQASPRLRVQLPTEFFQKNILDKEGDTELSNNNNFKNFIRGLYFKSEAVNDAGTMMLLDFSNSEAGITLYYTTEVEGEEDRKSGSYKLVFGPNRVNTFSQDLKPEIASEISTTDDQVGAKNLFLRGGEGVLTVVKLFEDEAELEELRANNWLINEANLTFFVNQDKVQGGDSEPERIYLYNLDTKEPLVDYYRDPSQNASIPFTSHAGKLERTEDNNGISYKIRLTEHVNRVLNKDSANVRLGLVVSQNITEVTNAALKNSVDGIDRVPKATINTPKGTVLYGNLADDEAKKLQFNIFYTKTND
jgi:hypothetical protein